MWFGNESILQTVVFSANLTFGLCFSADQKTKQHSSREGLSDGMSDSPSLCHNGNAEYHLAKSCRIIKVV